MALHLRARARKTRNRWLNQELRQLESARKRLQRGEADVLVLSDSSCLFGAANDPDPAMIPELISRQLGGARTASIVGPGFNAHLHGEVLRILSTLDARPKAVVVSAAIRTNTMAHVRHHPIYSYPQTYAALQATDSARHRIRSLGRGHAPPSREDYAAFESIAITTRWSGATTIGEFRAAVKGLGPQPWPIELERKLFDYFHGEIVPPDDPALAHVTRLGTRLKEYGVPAALFWVPPSKDRGEMLFPGEFADQVDRNWGLVRDAMLEGSGDAVAVIEPDLDEIDFQDAQDGTEHYSYSGRLKIAEEVAGALRAAGAPGSPRTR